MAGLAANAGASVSAVAGVRFALEPGRGRTAVPVRSALFGTALAVLIVVATLTFGSGLDTLVSHPDLYGWNWSYAISSNYLVPPQSWTLLDKDPDVAALSGVSFANAQINGLTVPIILANAHASVTVPLLSGHALEANNQIVLGAATLAQLHKRVGDTVVATYGSPKDDPVYVPPTRLRIVGTATLPAVGSSQPFTLRWEPGRSSHRDRASGFPEVPPQPEPDAQRPDNGVRPTACRCEPCGGAGGLAEDCQCRKQGIPRRAERWGGRSERPGVAGPVSG